jgi:glycosyltransferase involved in cell wall biosynthesis
MPDASGPLVSIGVPTFERAALLRRAVESALAQTYDYLEVVISDNASADGTEELCRALAARDPRVRYLRQHCNLGPTANFNALFAECRGDYVLMLADDDWFDPDYVAACLEVLTSDPRAALVAGRATYVRGGTFVHDGVLHDHREQDSGARVRAYLASVEDNGVFYGVMPRRVLEAARPLPDILGNDWLHVARIAFQGQVRTLQDVAVHRELDGTSINVTSILRTFGRPPWQARMPQLVVAWHLLRDIAWGHPIYAALPLGRRLALAIGAAAASVRWRALAWHLVTPSVAALRRRPRGRRFWQLYVRVTRALGAGRQP